MFTIRFPHSQPVTHTVITGSTSRFQTTIAGKGPEMTRLVETMRELGIDGEIEMSGSWVRIQGERCRAYVAEVARGGYYTWCDDRHNRSIRYYRTPSDAIRAAIERASSHPTLP
jgi:hypothetical protein